MWFSFAEVILVCCSLVTVSDVNPTVLLNFGRFDLSEMMPSRLEVTGLDEKYLQALVTSSLSCSVLSCTNISFWHSTRWFPQLFFSIFLFLFFISCFLLMRKDFSVVFCSLLAFKNFYTYFSSSILLNHGIISSLVFRGIDFYSLHESARKIQIWDCLNPACPDVILSFASFEKYHWCCFWFFLIVLLCALVFSTLKSNEKFHFLTIHATCYFSCNFPPLSLLASFWIYTGVKLSFLIDAPNCSLEFCKYV